MKVKAQKIPKKQIKLEDTIARFCYYFPQYTFYEAMYKLPFRRVVQMLKVADRERAMHYLELTNIAAAPHTKRGAGVGKLRDAYTKAIES